MLSLRPRCEDSGFFTRSPLRCVFTGVVFYTARSLRRRFLYCSKPSTPVEFVLHLRRFLAPDYSLKSETKLYCDTCNKFLVDRLVEGSCPTPGYNYDFARRDQCENCGKLLNPTELIKGLLSILHVIDVLSQQPVAITIKSKSTLALVKIDSSIPSPNATMTQSSSSFVGKSSCRMKERRCDYGDLCRISVSRTSDNPGRKFRGCPNYKDPDGGCGYFKWLDEDDFVSSDNKWCRTQQMNTVTMLLTLIVGLLMAILICLVIVVIKM
ncbi:hypothetical protein LXL04_012697 [Taraxacum kok-saghyz]